MKPGPPIPPRPRVSTPPAGPGRVLQGRVSIGRPQFRPAAVQAAPAPVRGHSYQVTFPLDLDSPRAGQLLPPAVQRKMEAALGADFSDVRVHVGPQAEQIGALAFTAGSHLYFAPGRYDPHSAHGQRLLGHELAHVVQQRTGLVRNPFGSGLAVVQDPALEAAADRMALRAAMAPEPAGARVVVPPAPGLQLRPAPHAQAARGSLDRFLPVPGAGASVPMAGPNQVVQPFGVLEGLAIGAAVTVGVVGIGYGLYSLYQWATQKSPGYYVKILTKPGLLSPSATSLADGTLDMLEQRFLSKRDDGGRPKPSHRAMRRGTWLSDIDPDGKLHVIGHGIPVTDEAQVPQYASLLSGYTSDEVADMLVDDYRLPASFRGRIVLLVCHSGSRTDTQRSLAEDLLRDIRLKGPNPTSIKALLGTGTVDEDTGQTVVRPDASVGVWARWPDLFNELMDMKNNLSSYDRKQQVGLIVRALKDPTLASTMAQETRRKIIDWTKEDKPFSTKRALQELMTFIRANLDTYKQKSAAHKVVYN